MRFLPVLVLSALTTFASAAAQEPIFGSPAGQVLDSVSIYIGMDYEEAVRRLSTKFERLASPSPEHAIFARAGEPAEAPAVNVVGRDGRVFLMGSTWTPATHSSGAFAEKLTELITLLVSGEGTGARVRECQLQVIGTTQGNYVRIAEIACGPHMIHIVRTRVPYDGERPSLQLLTR